MPAVAAFRNLFMVAAFILSAPANADYVFSAPPRGAGIDESDVYRPVAAYLSAATGKKIAYRHSDNWLTYQNEMRKGTYDLVFDGPHFLSWRMIRLQHEPVAKLPGKLVFALVTRKENEKINAVKDLAGRVVCGLAPPNLATLTLLAQFDNPARQPLVLEVQSFKEAFEGVVKGRCVGASLPVGVVKNLDKDGTLRTLYQSNGVPNQGFSAGPRFSPEDRAKMAQALVAAEAKVKMAKFFDTWNKDKDLLPATHTEYDGVAVLLKDTFGFDLAANEDGSAKR